MNSGSYQIFVRLSSDVTFKCGALGKIALPEGFYVYTGSAMRGLAARVARHRRTAKQIRWHIDYLLAEPQAAIVDVLIFPSNEREECAKNQALIAAGATVPIEGFGSSDCRECPAHLVRLPQFPD